MSAAASDLDRIRVRFATFRASSAREREEFARRLRPLATAASERVVLDTCHRVEMVSVDGPEAPDDGAIQGIAAVERVFEVVAGFDSAVVAEEQLLGQVRGAYEAALAAGSTGPILNELLRRALRFGRTVRSHALPGTDRSLADPAIAWLEERLGAAPETSGEVAVAGTGEMGRLLATALAERGMRLIIVSSSAERGGRLLGELAGEGHRLVVGTISSQALGQAAAVVLAVRARTPMITTHVLGPARPWVMDLSAPSAVEAGAAAALGDRLMTLDELATLGGGTPVLAPDVERRLRADLRREVEAFVAWLDARRGADALQLLHGEAEAVRRRHLERLRRRGSLDEGQLEAVEAAASAMLGELLHGPSLELRRGGADADTVRRLFGLGS